VGLDEFDELEEFEGVDVVAEDGAGGGFYGERDDVVGVGVVDRGLGHVWVDGAEMLEDRLLAVGLHTAEVAAGVVRVDAGAGAEQERGGAFGLHAGEAGGGADADELGDELVGQLDEVRAALKRGRVEEHFGVVHQAADRDAEEGVALVEEARDGPEVRHLGVGGLEGADDGGLDAGVEEELVGGGDGAVDGGQIAHLPAGEAGVGIERALVAEGAQVLDVFLGEGALGDGVEADFAAGVAAKFEVVGEVEAGFAEFLLGLEELAEGFLVLGAAQDDGGVVGGGALGVLGEPVAGLGGHHLLVVAGEEADGGRAADTAGEHGARDVHADVIHFDGAELAAAGAGEDALGLVECLLEREVAGGLAAGGLEGGAAGADLREIELDLGVVVVALEEREEGIGPAFDGVADGVVDDGEIEVARADGQCGEAGDVVLLHGEAAAGAGEEQEEVLFEELDAVDRAVGAVEHARVVLEDRIAAELQRAHRGEHAAVAHGFEGAVDQSFERLAEEPLADALAVGGGDEVREVFGDALGRAALEFGGEVVAVHLADAFDGLGEGFAAAELGAVAGVLGGGDVVGEAVVLIAVEAALGLAAAVDDVAAGDFPLALGGDGFLDDVLELLDGGMFALMEIELGHHGGTLGDGHGLEEGLRIDAPARGGIVDVGVGGAVMRDVVEGERDGAGDLGGVPGNETAVPFDDEALTGGGGWGEATKKGRRGHSEARKRRRCSGCGLGRITKRSAAVRMRRREGRRIEQKRKATPQLVVVWLR